MPDFERYQDSLRLYIARKDPVKLAKVSGYIQGKNRARVEILVVSALVALTNVAWQFVTRGG
jgi:hypothetical protein